MTLSGRGALPRCWPGPRGSLRPSGLSAASFTATMSVLAAVLALGGCGGEERAPSPSQLYHPPAFHPEHFPDIPLFPVAGYQLIPGEDQLAVSLAGGSVRRFEVSMIERQGARPDPGSAVLARYDSELPPLGWERMGELARGHWRKGPEDLFIEAGRSGGLTTIRFHLRPTPAAPASQLDAPGATAPEPPAR